MHLIRMESAGYANTLSAYAYTTQTSVEVF